MIQKYYFALHVVKGEVSFASSAFLPTFKQLNKELMNQLPNVLKPSTYRRIEKIFIICETHHFAILISSDLIHHLLLLKISGLSSHQFKQVSIPKLLKKILAPPHLHSAFCQHCTPLKKRHEKTTQSKTKNPKTRSCPIFTSLKPQQKQTKKNSSRFPVCFCQRSHRV